MEQAICLNIYSMSDKGLPKQIFDEIAEAVKHGIVTSKQTESALIRDIQVTLNRIENSQEYLKTEITDIKEYQKAQNGKVFKLSEVIDGQEKEIVSLDKWRSWTTGIATASVVLIGTIIGLAIFIFQSSVDGIKEDISRLEAKK